MSNQNLYKLGKRKNLPGVMVAVKFEPVENWLPPGFILKMNQIGNSLYWENPKKSLKKQEIEKVQEEKKEKEVKKEHKEEEEKVNEEEKEKEIKVAKEHKDKKAVGFEDDNDNNSEEKEKNTKEKKEENETTKSNEETEVKKSNKKRRKNKKKSENTESTHETSNELFKDCRKTTNEAPKTATDAPELHHFVPYNLQTQHSIPDKSIADCVEAIIGLFSLYSLIHFHDTYH